MSNGTGADAQVGGTLREIAKGIAPLVFITIAVLLLSGCTAQPARNRVTPGQASVNREVQGPTRWRIEVRQPPRVYVPTQAEVEGDR